MDQMLIGRILLLILGIIASYWFVSDFDFDSKPNRLIAKGALIMLFLRGLGVVFFDIFNLFPID